MQPTAHVPLPDLEIRDGTPVSAAFDDVYFSRLGGIAESQYVYLQGNGLPGRFGERSQFTIGELGFGTGLNFLVAWQEFLRAASADGYLHYIAVEKFPLTPGMLRAALALYPELDALAESLLAAYPLRLPGLHRIHLPRVTLTLGFGDVAEILPELKGAVDAWFLDGFTPAKNPAMWSADVLAGLHRLSAPGTTFATFTAARDVRDGLAGVGFAVEKIRGFGHKRTMLVGRLNDASWNLCSAARELRSGGVREVKEARRPSQNNTLVLGAGIGGATLARALAERGMRVTVLERGAVAGGASGNPAAVLFPQLSKRWNVSTAWYFAAYGFMLQQLQRWTFDIPHAQPGMLRLPRHTAEEVQLRGLGDALGLDASIVRWVEREEAQAISGVALATGAAFLPQGTWLDPAALCRALLRHPNITLHENTAAVSLAREGENWRIETAAGDVYTAVQCCLASAHETAVLAPQFGLKLNPVGGQVSVVDAKNAAAPLRSILCHKGYVIPAGEHYLIGATYHHDGACEVTAENHRANLGDVETFLPGWLLRGGEAVGGRASLRATTPDRLPYIGQLAEGLWVSTGHGSRGMLSAPLGAEIIASAMHGEAAPVTRALRGAVDPLRFRPPVPRS